MNGGPREFLSWVIEATDQTFTPAKCAEWLKGRLPQPVDDHPHGLSTKNNVIPVKCYMTSG